jgi:hypothetical protein
VYLLFSKRDEIDMSVSKRLNRILQDLEKSSSVSYSTLTTTTSDDIVIDPPVVNDADDETNSSITLKRKLVENMSSILFSATERKKRKYLERSSTTDNDNNTNNTNPHKPIQSISDEGGNDNVTELTNIPTSLKDHDDIKMNDITVLPSTSSNTSIGKNSNNENIVESIRELRNVYLHGLQTVSKLQDLRDAPDAILPGNFCT